ncbi:NB-ARC domain-containing protein [Lentzea sp. BCCO 10_0856]|uniref:NB-ARC domain-containing protein n=1 Tax=Lentzea miocenica TaxID=3095431 RepID=A0ABU4T7L0_9PSEU|nr:NB-ARC domain-containing protein [Lentzea sp. BCCO 10_0856]MDX8034160.1 NB-ARC domain-containing protein [Lentzea sp. BCCO 10_0856]
MAGAEHEKPAGAVHNEVSGSADSVVQIGTVLGDLVMGDRTKPSPAAPFMAPRPPANFTERVHLGDQLLEALLEPTAGGGRPVVLCGLGGFGKTSMATWACHQPAVRERFSDGVLWVELGRNPSEQRLASLLSDVTALVAGTAPRVFATVPAAAEAFRDVLATRRLLLVLDDTWAGDAVDPFLSDGPQCVRLVTTRNRGLVDGTSVTVDALDDEEARAILSVDLPDDAAAHVGPLAARVGRWPLALTMLGGTLRSLVTQHGLPVAEAVRGVVTELDRHGITSADQLSDVELRRGIATTLELSLADLADSAGAASVDRLRSIAAFPQGALVPFAWLEQLWQLGAVHTRIECDRFVRRCLASGSASGIRLHDVTREALRENRSPEMSAVSAALLACPNQGWHVLPESPLADQLAYHLVQAGRADELGSLLLDMRYQVERMWTGGPLAFEADVTTYSTVCPADGHTATLASMLRQEAHLFVGHQNHRDLALTLHSRLVSRPELLERTSHVPEVVGEGGWAPLRPFPDCVDSAALARVLAGHRGPAASITCHPDGHLIATAGSYDTTVRIWDTRTWSETNVIVVPDAALDTLRWSPNGAFIAVVGRTSRFRDDSDEWSQLFTVLIFDAGTGDEVTAFGSRGRSAGSPVAIAWSPDSSSLAVSSTEEVGLWPVVGGEPVRLKPPAANGPAHVIALDWHGEHGLAALSTDRRLLWWRDPVSSSDVIAWRHEDFLGVRVRLEWRPRGTSLALSTRDSLMILDPRGQTVLWSESPAELLIYHAAGWSPDGRSLSSYRSDRHRAASLVTWRVPPDPRLEAGEVDLVGRIDCGIDESMHDDLVWLRSGTMVATAGAPVVKVWRPENSAEQDPSGRALDAVRWSPDGRQLAVRRHGQWALIDLDRPDEPPRQEPSYPFGTPPVTNDRERAEAAGIEPAMYELHPVVEFASSESQRAVAFWFGAIKILRTGQREPVRALEKPAATRWASLCFTPDESRLVSLAEDSAYTAAEIIVWDLATGERAATAQLSAEDFELSSTADKLTASDHHVAVVTRSGLLGLYEIEGLRPVGWIKVNGRLRDASFDPDGNRLAVVGDAGLYLLRVPRNRGGACST